MRRGQGQSVINRLPPAMKHQLYLVGLNVSGDDVADTDVLLLEGPHRILRGVDGVEALRYLADRRRMAFLQETLSSDEQFEGVDQAGEAQTLEGREWSLRSQIIEICERNRDMPAAARAGGGGWTAGVQHLGLQLKHATSSSFQWSRLTDLAGSAEHIATQMIIDWL